MDIFSKNKAFPKQVGLAAAERVWGQGKRPEFLGTAVKCHDTRVVILFLTLRIVLCLCTALSSLERPSACLARPCENQAKSYQPRFIIVSQQSK